MWNNQGNQSYGDQGGGYVNSPGNMGSPGASQGGARKVQHRAQAMVPITAAQFLAAQSVDDNFMLDDIDLHQITIVGMIRAVRETSTRIEYDLDDMTGPLLEIRQFVDNDENTPEEERTAVMRENTYVRVYGHTRSFNEKRSIAAFKVVPLVDMNELTTHLLEVIHTHLLRTKNQPTNNGQATAMDTGDAHSARGQPNYDSNSGLGEFTGLNNIQQQVALVIRSCSDDSGLSITTICEKLRGVPQQSIRDSIEFLSSEGHIYSTIDDDHFKSTDATE